MFWQKINQLWLIGSSALIALLAFLLWRRGEKLADLQAEVIKNQLNKELNALSSRVQEKRKKYDEAIRRYNKLKHASRNK